MDKYTPENVFDSLNKRVVNLETGIDERFTVTQTAIAQVEQNLQRRIDRLDKRMDAFCKQHGGDHDQRQAESF